MHRLIINVIILCHLTDIVAIYTSDCKFARTYKLTELFHSPQLQDQFMESASWWEGKLAMDRVGVNFNTALTYEGFFLDRNSGGYSDAIIYLHPGFNFVSDIRQTNAQHEGVHLALLANALDGAKYARIFFNSSLQDSRWRGTMDEFLIDQLSKKVDHYLHYYARFPGNGGYLPIAVAVDDDGLGIYQSSEAREIRAGQHELFVWAFAAASQALQDKNHMELAQKYANYFNILAKNGLSLFYNQDTNLNGVLMERTNVSNPSKARNTSEPNQNLTMDNLDDYSYAGPYALFLHFYANFTTFNGKDAQKWLWLHFGRSRRSEFQTRKGYISYEQGTFFSSNEKLKYLLLPFFDIPLIELIYLNGEKVRTYYSAERRLPGLFASVCNYTYDEDERDLIDYEVFYGISQLAKVPLQITGELIAPYAAFPLILHPATRSYGIVWYAAMLNGSRMQGPFGATDSSKIDGVAISKSAHWNHKAITVLAFDGGIVNLIRRFMNATDRITQFRTVIEDHWKQYWDTKIPMKGVNLDFALPSVTMHRDDGGGDTFTCTGMATYRYCQDGSVFVCDKFWIEFICNALGICMVGYVLFVFFVLERRLKVSVKYFTIHVFSVHLTELIVNIIWISIIYRIGFPYYRGQWSAYLICFLEKYIRNYFLTMCFILMASVTLLSILISLLWPLQTRIWFSDAKRWGIYMAFCYVLAFFIPITGLHDCHGKHGLDFPMFTLRMEILVLFVYLIPAGIALACAIVIGVILRQKSQDVKEHIKAFFSLTNYAVFPLIWCIMMQTGAATFLFGLVVKVKITDEIQIVLDQCSFYFRITFGMAHAMASLCALAPARNATLTLIKRAMAKLTKAQPIKARLIVVSTSNASESRRR